MTVDELEPRLAALRESGRRDAEGLRFVRLAGYAVRTPVAHLGWVSPPVQPGGAKAVHTVCNRRGERQRPEVTGAERVCAWCVMRLASLEHIERSKQL